MHSAAFSRDGMVPQTIYGSKSPAVCMRRRNRTPLTHFFVRLASAWLTGKGKNEIVQRRLLGPFHRTMLTSQKSVSEPTKNLAASKSLSVSEKVVTVEKLEQGLAEQRDRDSHDQVRLCKRLQQLAGAGDWRGVAALELEAKVVAAAVRAAEPGLSEFIYTTLAGAHHALGDYGKAMYYKHAAPVCDCKGEERPSGDEECAAATLSPQPGVGVGNEPRRVGTHGKGSS